jgi:hypothetical protein
VVGFCVLVGAGVVAVLVCVPAMVAAVLVGGTAVGLVGAGVVAGLLVVVVFPVEALGEVADVAVGAVVVAVGIGVGVCGEAGWVACGS